jgi:hypothetical protein
MIKFHVYQKDNQVIDHSLTIEELEAKVRDRKISLSDHQIQLVDFSPSKEESSY